MNVALYYPAARSLYTYRTVDATAVTVNLRREKLRPSLMIVRSYVGGKARPVAVIVSGGELLLTLDRALDKFRIERLRRDAIKCEYRRRVQTIARETDSGDRLSTLKNGEK